MQGENVEESGPVCTHQWKD